MGFNFAEFLLNSTHEYNGHKQTTTTGISFEQALDICKDLEEINDHKIYVVECYTCAGMTILEKDTWKQGEHPLGHTDRIILHIEGE